MSEGDASASVERQLGIGEVGRAVNRRPHTIRTWERAGWLPAALAPARNEKGWRFWTRAQVEGLKAWMSATDLRPGRAICATTADGVYAKLRAPRPRRRDAVPADRS